LAPQLGETDVAGERESDPCRRLAGGRRADIADVEQAMGAGHPAHGAGGNQAGHPGTAGADLSKLAPSDIVVALRGRDRRYRELFEALGEDESADDVAHCRAADGWSAIDHIVAATQPPPPRRS
jgi:hypothetical protein